MDRFNRLQADLTDIAADLSGYDVADLGADIPFLSLGFDSLFLTQLATAFQRAHGVKITFRQLIDSVPTINAVASFIDEALPKEAAKPVEAPIATASVAPKPAAAPMMLSGAVNSDLAGVFAAQLTLMQKQLEALGQVSQRDVKPAITDSAAVVSASPTASVDCNAVARTFVPIVSEGIEGVTDTQRAHVERLTKRYNAKTKKSKERTQRDRQYHADPRTAAGFNDLWKEVVYPIVVEKSSGAHLWDVDGNKYVDLLNGFGPNFFGHRAPFITDAIRRQLDEGFEVGPQTPLAGEAARLLCEMTGMDRVSWVNTGSEAVQAAMRISRTVTGRDKVVLFNGDYHGNFDEVLVRGISGKNGPRTHPLAPGIPTDSVSNVIVLEYGEESALKYMEEHAEDIACVLVEPVQSRRPEFQPKEFLIKLRKLTKDREIVLVFDEVITGFRTCPGGAQEYYGVEADIATYGKIIGGGMPIGVVAGRSKFMDTFDGGFWQYGDDSKPTAGVTFFAGTFVRHPMTIAAVHASLSYLKAAGPALQRGVNAKAERLASTLNAFFTERGVDIFVAQFASQMFVRVKEKGPLATLLFYHLRDRGVHVLEGFPSYMTAAHTDEDVDFIINAFKQSVEEMQVDGLLPGRGDVIENTQNASIPLTSGQQEIWATCQLGDNANCAYNESDTFKIEGPLDANKFRTAVTDSLNACDALHFSFDEEGREQIRPEGSIITPEWLDWTDKTQAQRDDAMASLLTSYANKPFDLSSGRLVRAAIVRMSADCHYFILYAHHLVFDGYSAGLLFEDIALRYEDRTANAALEDYRSYVNASAEGSEAALRYWTDIYGTDAPDALALPTDRSFPVERNYKAKSVHKNLALDTFATAKETARQLGITLNSFLLATYAALLGRISGQDDIVVGVPVAGQPVFGVETIGCCVNTVPLRLRPTFDKSFAEFSKETHTAMMEGSGFVGFSMIDLLGETNLPRDPARPTLLQAVFNFSRLLDDSSLAGCRVSAMENPRTALVYDLFANLTEENGRLVADWEFASSPLDTASVEAWMTQFELMIASIGCDVDQPIGSLKILDEDQQTAIVSSLAGPPQHADTSQTAFAMIASIAAQQPDAVAIVQDDISVTYRELQESANRFAAALRNTGVSAGDFVGVSMERRPTLLPLLLGIWQAGAAYLPLDMSYPIARIQAMVADSSPRLVIADSQAAGQMASTGANVLSLADLTENALKQAKDFNPVQGIDGDSAAYLLYTSGSTGIPKGVVNTHRPLSNFLLGLAAQDGLREVSSVLALTTLSFDISIIELIYPLTVGACVVLATAEEGQDGQAISALLERYRPSMMQGTPSTYRLILDADWQGDPNLIALSGGEPLTVDIASAITERVKTVWNFYGPTEASVYCTCGIITNSNAITIGRPMAGTHLYVLDAAGNICPPGVIGELCIGGDGVCLGYWNRPELTAARFIDDPYSGKDGAKMYRTGDRARIGRDGRVDLLGREDNQVKLRGFRIELGEIEAALESNRDIDVAVCRVINKPGEEAALVAYIQCTDDEAPTGSELRKWLRHSLPNYMIPQFFVEVDQMPLTGAGKIDRNALPNPLQANKAPVQAVAPRDDTEETIAAVWSEILGVSNVSVTDNFFELGGQSLQAAQMVAHVRRRTGRRIAPRDVIYETLEQLAAGSQAS